MTAPSKTSYWPYAIIMVFVLFGLYIGYFIYQSTKYDVNLVSENYYEDEINYQERIASIERSQPYKNEYRIEPGATSISVHLPSSITISSGNITFYRPSDAHRDIKIKLHANMSHTINIPKNKIGDGHWMVKASIMSNDERYYFEKPLNL